VAQQALAESPMGQMLVELHALARQGTSGDQPVPPERYEAVLRMSGLAGRVLELLPSLYEIDREWMAGAAEIRKQRLEAAKDERSA